jgi:transposase
MSIVDDLRGLESRLAKRMKELRPMVEEYQELEQIARRLGLADDPTGTESAPRKPAASTRSATSRRKRAGSTGANRGRRRAARSTTTRPGGPAPSTSDGRQQQVAGIVQQRPGITVREVAAELGVDPTSLYRVVRRLEKDGTIKKQGRQLQPV